MSLHPGPISAPVLDLVDTNAEFEELASEWDAFVASSASGGIFLTWPWISAWRATIGSEHRLFLITARHPMDGRLVAAAPFVVERRRRGGVGHDVLAFIGSGPAAPDHLDLITRRGHEDLGRVLWREVRRRGGWDLADLDGVRAGSLLARAALRREDDGQHVIDVEPCPFTRLPDTWEAYESTLGKNHRQNIRRYARKMDREADHPVITRMVTDRAEVPATMERLGTLHQDIRTAKGDRGAFHSPEMRSLHLAVALAMFDAGRLRLHRLDVGGEAVAVIWCMRFGDTVSFYATGYDETWAKYGPGRRIMAAAIESAIDEGATEFDFLRGAEPYKQAWTTTARLEQRIMLPGSRRGRALWALRNLKQAVRQT